MGSNTVFIISDLHLNLLPAPKRRSFLHFFRTVVARRATALYLNGDIIDLLAPALSPEERRDLRSFADELEGMARRDVPIHYVLGNHDLPMLSLFDRDGVNVDEFLDVHTHRHALDLAPNLTLHYRSVQFDYADKRVYVEHGHIYDLGWVQGQGWQRAMEKAAHLDVGQDWLDSALAAREAFQSYSENGEARLIRTGRRLPPPIYGSLQAPRLAHESNCDWIILGHFHSPGGVEDLGEGRLYVNSGDSLQHGSYVVLAEGELRIGDWRETVDALDTEKRDREA